MRCWDHNNGRPFVRKYLLDIHKQRMLNGGSRRCEKACETCRDRKAKCGMSSFCLNVKPPSPSSDTLVHPQLLRAAEQDAWDLAAPKPAMVSLQASREEHPGEDEHNSGLFSMPGMTDEEVWRKLWDSVGDGEDVLSFEDRISSRPDGFGCN